MDILLLVFSICVTEANLNVFYGYFNYLSFQFV